jgi:hypothetical protein
VHVPALLAFFEEDKTCQVCKTWQVFGEGESLAGFISLTKKREAVSASRLAP